MRKTFAAVVLVSGQNGNKLNTTGGTVPEPRASQVTSPIEGNTHLHKILN